MIIVDVSKSFGGQDEEDYDTIEKIYSIKFIIKSIIYQIETLRGIIYSYLIMVIILSKLICPHSQISWCRFLIFPKCALCKAWSAYFNSVLYLPSNTRTCRSSPNNRVMCFRGAIITDITLPNVLFTYMSSFFTLHIILNWNFRVNPFTLPKILVFFK